MRISRLLFVVSLLLGAPGPGLAQTADPLETFREIGNKILVESKVFPLMRGTLEGQNSPEPIVTLLATNDGAVAKARLGYLLKDFFSLDATFSGPIAGGTGQLLTQKGIGAGVSAEGTLRVVLHRTQHSERLPSGMASPLGAPSVIANRNMTSGVFSFDDLVASALDVATGIEAAGGPELARNVARSASVAGLFENPQALGSSAAPVRAAASQLDNEKGREAFAAAFRLLANDLEAWQVDRAVVLSLGGALTRPTFTLVDGNQFRSITKDAKTGEVSFGIISSARRDKLTRGYYTGITVTAGKTYSATARNTCLPVGDAGATQCRNAIVAEPSTSEVESYQGDFRYFFSNLKFAVGIRPGYDRKAPKDEKWSVEIPLLFLQNSKDLQSALADEKAGLTGGVTVGIRDSPNGAVFSAMFSVGSIFRLPGLPR
jgi:hypothetical protein